MGELRKNIAIVFGGFSGERVISEKSALLVQKYLADTEYNTFLVDIDVNDWQALVDGTKIAINRDDFSFEVDGSKVVFDGVFNAIHGTPGEDGKLQGYFDLIGMPYNNCGVLASSLSFDKAACNRYLKASGVNVADSYLARLGTTPDAASIIDRVGLPCFVKPNDGGSSIGVTKVKRIEDLEPAIKLAQEEEVDALIESFLDGVEVSCGCISVDGKARAIGVTEIVPEGEFFDFNAKYESEKTEEITPARISREVYDQIMEQTELIYAWLHCKGMIRIDYMICKDGVYLIEVNTTPGLSEESIIPKQALHAGYSLTEFFQLSTAAMFG